MQKMKKYLLALLLLTSVFAVAAETEFVQFTDADYNTYTTPGQNWLDARMITLKVSKGSTVYLTSKTRSWDETIPDLADTTYTDKYGRVLENTIGYDMSKDKYGYVYAKIDEAGNASPDGDIHLADGKTKTLTLTDGTNSRTATGYLLDTFDKEAEIFLVMTPHGFNSTIDTYSHVQEGDNSALQGRQRRTGKEQRPCDQFVLSDGNETDQ